MADTNLDDPELLLAIEQALAPFTRLLPASTLDHMRREMALQLSTHEHTAAMLRHLRSDAVVQESGTRVSDESESEPGVVSAPIPSSWGTRGGR